MFFFIGQFDESLDTFWPKTSRISVSGKICLRIQIFKVNSFAAGGGLTAKKTGVERIGGSANYFFPFLLAETIPMPWYHTRGGFNLRYIYFPLLGIILHF